VWALNGELFYRNQSGDRLMAVSVATQPTLQVGLPREIFAAPFYGGGAVAGAPRAIYDVTKDGQRFLMLREVTADNERIETPRLIVVQNWFEELKRLVPVN
jgi:hypothetical protein